MTINFDTAVKGLEQWNAPKGIKKSGFGTLKVEGHDLTVCAQAVGNIHKIGAQLRRLGDMNTSKDIQDWKDNNAVVRQLNQEIEALGNTLDTMKEASSNLNTPDDIKAGIRFTRHLAAKVNQIEHALKGIEDKLDQTTLEHVLGISHRLEDLTNKNAAVRAELNRIKVAKQLEPEGKSKVNFSRLYAGASKLPGIGRLIKGFAKRFNPHQDSMEPLQAKINNRDEYLSTPQELATRLRFHKKVIVGIFRKLNEDLANKSIRSDEKENLIQKSKTEISNLLNYYNSQQNKLPENLEVQEDIKTCQSLSKKIDELGEVVAKNAELIRSARKWDAVLDKELDSPSENNAEILSEATENLQALLNNSTDEKDKEYIKYLIGLSKALSTDHRKNYFNDQINTITNELDSLSSTIKTKFASADLDDINAWQPLLTRFEMELNELEALLKGKETTEYPSIQSAKLEISELKETLGDRKIILEVNNNLEIIKNHLNQIRDSSSNIEDKAVALNEIIILTLPKQLSSLKRVTSANTEGSKNFHDYSLVREEMDVLTKAATKDLDRYLNSPKTPINRLRLGERTLALIFNDLKNDPAYQSRLSDEKENVIQVGRTEISNLLKYYDSQESKLPRNQKVPEYLNQGRQACQNLSKQLDEIGGTDLAQNAALMRSAREWEAVLYSQNSPETRSNAVKELRTLLNNSTDKKDKEYIENLIKLAEQ